MRSWIYPPGTNQNAQPANDAMVRKTRSLETTGGITYRLMRFVMHRFSPIATTKTALTDKRRQVDTIDAASAVCGGVVLSFDRYLLSKHLRPSSSCAELLTTARKAISLPRNRKLHHPMKPGRLRGPMKNNRMIT